MFKSRQLEKAMSVIQTDDADGHKQIYSYSVQNMDPQGVPHIAALIYGSGRVLLPEMHWNSTSELLDIFALAELVRQQTVADAMEALEWNQFYRKDGAAAADGVPLTDEERKTLKAIVKTSTSGTHRATYRSVVMQVCWAHLHRLRRSNETLLITLLFPQYFPSVGELRTLESTDKCPLWLRSMSQSELSLYEVTREKVIEFLEDAEDWEEEYLTEVSRAGMTPEVVRNTPQYQTDFFDRFPLLVRWDMLTSILQRHLTKIQNIVAKLHSIFPDNTKESYVEADSKSDISPLNDTVQHKTNAVPDIQEEIKKESQETNVSSGLSYVDVPENVPHAPPTSLLRRDPQGRLLA